MKRLPELLPRWSQLLAVPICLSLFSLAVAQPLGIDESPPPEEAPAETPTKVDVNPLVEDTEIAARLTRILEATDWFRESRVRVDEGVVFLQGEADTEQHREWAGRLATNTQDVVAVVNQMGVLQRSMWDLSPAFDDLQQLAAEAVRNSPLFLVGLLTLVLTWWISKWTVRSAGTLFRKRFKSQLLSDVAARAAGVPMFLLGLYLVLRISGLTRLAMTVIGSTGLIALVIGFAFRDIAENFLASILISIQQPFARGDLIKVAGYMGYVQSVNARSALLMTLDGNHVQIPNATIYKEIITNFTANPNARYDFLVGIGYGDSISKAQAVALEVLQEHPAVVDDPEPMVLVESLGSATVNLRVYFWVDVAKYSPLKVCSAVIRLTKRAFEQSGISMPDEAREIVFPEGVPVRTLPETAEPSSAETEQPAASETEEAASTAEGDLASQAVEIQQQAQQSRNPEAGQDLLN